jgi:hypothetical protein
MRPRLLTNLVGNGNKKSALTRIGCRCQFLDPPRYDLSIYATGIKEIIHLDL